MTTLDASKPQNDCLLADGSTLIVHMGNGVMVTLFLSEGTTLVMDVETGVNEDGSRTVDGVLHVNDYNEWNF